jgi:hypothetical protein
VTKFKNINIGDQQTLEVIGYDAQGNVFSSLEGIRFAWSIAHPEKLEVIALKNSQLHTTARRLSLEA